jgi:hypothetical protein
MCLTTLYDSPTCGHTWTSLTTPCTPYSDLLSCASRSPARYLIAPPHTCPTCNGGFADGETLQMVQGPWGCNQVVRNYYGGEWAVGGGWMGDARVSGPYAGGYGGGYGYGGSGITYGGPAITYGSPDITCGGPAVGMNRLTYGDGYVNGVDECCSECCDAGSGFYADYAYGGGKRYRKQDYRYRYRRETRDGACCVM